MDSPTYRPLKPDGATFKCTDCENQFPHNQVWFVTLPNGWKGIVCHECIDETWKTEFATFIPEPI